MLFCSGMSMAETPKEPLRIKRNWHVSVFVWRCQTDQDQTATKTLQMKEERCLFDFDVTRAKCCRLLLLLLKKWAFVGLQCAVFLFHPPWLQTWLDSNCWSGQIFSTTFEVSAQHDFADPTPASVLCGDDLMFSWVSTVASPWVKTAVLSDLSQI